MFRNFQEKAPGRDPLAFVQQKGSFNELDHEKKGKFRILLSNTVKKKFYEKADTMGRNAVVLSISYQL
jgi:hypothetical protein